MLCLLTSRETVDLSLRIAVAIAVSVCPLASPSAMASRSGSDRYRPLLVT